MKSTSLQIMSLKRIYFFLECPCIGKMSCNSVILTPKPCFIIRYYIYCVWKLVEIIYRKNNFVKKSKEKQGRKKGHYTSTKNWLKVSFCNILAVIHSSMHSSQQLYSMWDNRSILYLFLCKRISFKLLLIIPTYVNNIALKYHIDWWSILLEFLSNQTGDLLMKLILLGSMKKTH